MDAVSTTLIEYYGIFGLIILGLFVIGYGVAWFLNKKANAIGAALNEHEDQCQEFRREVRNADAKIHKEIADLRTEMVQKDTRLEGKIDTVVEIVKRIERNGDKP